MFGVSTLIVIFIVFLAIFRDYDIKIGGLVASFITLIVAIFYYFTGLVNWIHLASVFGIFLLFVMVSFRVDE